MTIYLLHFSEPLGNERHQARHYLGYAPAGGVDKRIAEHAAGRGARITQVAVERGFSLTLARTWDGDRTTERRLKSQGHGPQKCPICQEARQ